MFNPRPVLLALGALVLWTAGCGDRAAGPAADARAVAWQADVQPVLGDYCVACHGGAEPAGSLDLERWAESSVPPAHAWMRAEAALAEHLAGHVGGGLMPPPDEMQPPDAVRDAFAAWWTEQLAAAWAAAPPDPGRVTMRRLNRYEYRRTVRDLVGIDFDTTEVFPSDDVGYGFDHIGDVLSMPPILFEKYLDAAERIAQEAVPVYDPDTPIRHEAEELPILGGGYARGGRVAFTSNGEVAVPVDIVLGGRYVVRARAWGDQALDEPAEMAIRLGSRRLKTHAVAAVARKPVTYELTAHMTRGRHELGVAFTNDAYRRGRYDRNLHVDWVEIQGPLPEGRDEVPALQQRVLACDPLPGEERACAQRIVRDLLGRAFRRPPTEVEVERHVALVMEAMAAGEPFRGGIQLALQAVLVSPHFLFRVEVDERSGPGTRAGPLGDHALASRLAYFLWSSLPDDALRAQADAGTLRANLHGEVTRMLEHPHALSSLVENFAGQWLELRRLETAAPDPKQFAVFDEKLRTSMRRETELVVAALIREDRSILELLDWPFTYVDERLAKHYRIPGVTGDFRRVSLDGTGRAGILSHASILTLTSYPTRTSPVQRGKWLMEEILGTPPPPPPPGVGALETQDPAMLKLTLRERLQKHREDPSCAVCHDRMDNLGYGLEVYDAVGGFRTHDGDVAMTGKGTLPDGRAFEGPEALRAILKADPGFPRCFAEKLLTYALGRGLEPYDRPAVLRIVDEARRGGYRFSSFVHAVVATDAFTMRRTAGASR